MNISNIAGLRSSVSEDGMKTRYALLAAAVLTTVAATPAAAQSVCGERVEIVNALEAAHKERKAAAGLSGNGGVVELFTAINGTWTLLLTLPGGPTCMLGAVGSKPQYTVRLPDARCASRPGVPCCTKPRHCRSLYRSDMARNRTKSLRRWQARSTVTRL